MPRQIEFDGLGTTGSANRRAIATASATMGATGSASAGLGLGTALAQPVAHVCPSSLAPSPQSLAPRPWPLAPGPSPLAPLLLLLCLSGCAGYQIGNQSLYPTGIHTVYVPMFESVSFRRNLGEQLTEAVVKQIELKTPYKVVNDPNADSILSGRLVSERKNVIVGTLTGEDREIEVNLKVQVSWVDRRGNMIRRAEPIPVPAEVTSVTGTADVIPEVGQSITTAQQQAISRLAQQIVGLMEAPW